MLLAAVAMVAIRLRFVVYGGRDCGLSDEEWGGRENGKRAIAGAVFALLGRVVRLLANAVAPPGYDGAESCGVQR